MTGSFRGEFPLRASDFEFADSLFAISAMPGVDHIVAATGDTSRQAIRRDVRIPYPNADDYTVAVSELLLPIDETLSTDDRKYYDLPHNYVLFRQAINDTIGEEPTAAALEQLKGYFAEIGYFVGRAARADHVLPRSLDYKQIIFSRETLGIGLLPPLSLEPITTDLETALSSSCNQFRNNCINASRDEAQQSYIIKAFEGFESSFLDQ